MITLIVSMLIAIGVCILIIATSCVVFGRTEYEFYDLERPDLIELEEWE